jgi:hypothetical protein
MQNAEAAMAARARFMTTPDYMPCRPVTLHQAIVARITESRCSRRKLNLPSRSGE